jgi:hypothetical protein
MTQNRLHLAPFDLVTLFFGALLGVTAGALTFYGWKQSDAILLSYPLMPGLIAGLLTTGGHGGTATEEAIAPWIASIVNAVFYFAIVVVARIIWLKLISRPPTAYRRLSNRKGNLQ